MKNIKYNVCKVCGTKYDINKIICPICNFSQIEEISEEELELEYENCEEKIETSDNNYQSNETNFVNKKKIIPEIEKYLTEINTNFDITVNNSFLGLKLNKSNDYYFLYIAVKENYIELCYRTNSMMKEKEKINITNLSLKNILDMVSIIINFTADQENDIECSSYSFSKIN